jgi:PIN like domain
LKVLFDNCTAPLFASTLNGFVSHYGHSAIHIRDVEELPNGRNSSDLEWIEYLQSSNEVWTFISGDGRILKNPAERAALRSAGLHGFVLAPGYQKTPLNQVAAILLWHWPEILRLTEILAAPSMHEVPIKRMTRLRALPL